MPWGLTRYHHSGQSYFVTFSCYQRRPLFMTDASRRLFENALERVRRSFRLRVYGYVVMPEHIHLLVSEPERDTLADVLKSPAGGGVGGGWPALRSWFLLYNPTEGAPSFAVFEGWARCSLQ
jgi:hypothetical protein